MVRVMELKNDRVQASHRAPSPLPSCLSASPPPHPGTNHNKQNVLGLLSSLWDDFCLGHWPTKAMRSVWQSQAERKMVPLHQGAGLQCIPMALLWTSSTVQSIPWNTSGPYWQAFFLRWGSGRVGGGGGGEVMHIQRLHLHNNHMKSDVDPSPPQELHEMWCWSFTSTIYMTCDVDPLPLQQSDMGLGKSEKGGKWCGGLGATVGPQWGPGAKLLVGVFSVCHHKKQHSGTWKSDICKSASFMFRPDIYLVILKIALKNVILVLKNKILAKVRNHLTATVSWDTSVKKKKIYIYIFWYSSKIYSVTGTAYFSTYQQQPKESHCVSKLRRIGISVPRSWELLKKKKYIHK